MLDVNSHLSATVVDRILGGRGSTNPEERGLTDIEKALVEDFNQIILEEWCKQWHNTMSLTPSIIGTESSGKFLQTSPSDAMMLIMSMEASFGDVSGPMRIAVPYYTLEPVVSRLLTAVASLLTFLTVVHNTRDVVVLESGRHLCIRVCTKVDAYVSRDRRLEIGLYINSVQTLTYHRRGVPRWTSDWEK